MSLAKSNARAAKPGLTFADPSGPGVRRMRHGDGFIYQDSNGRTIDARRRRHIQSLAIPPAWSDVWICPDPSGHIQAIGRDARGRLQYRYHGRFRQQREAAKFQHMVRFATALPAIRARIERDMRRPGLAREKVVATVVYLLENTLIRVGNMNYARTNKTYGLTTLKAGHVSVEGIQVKFAFKGKSGKQWSTAISDHRVARIIGACQDLPGQHLFQYLDERGERRIVTSNDINDYLREASGKPITAKDFRTWAGTVLALIALREYEPAPSLATAKRNLKDAIARVAAKLGNTPTICRKCYVHPRVLTAYLEGMLASQCERLAKRPPDRIEAALDAEEALALRFLRSRPRRKSSGGAAADNADLDALALAA